MKKFYLLTFFLFSILNFSQQLDADLHEINYKNGISASDLITLQNKILFRGTETNPYPNPLSLWAYDFGSQKVKEISTIRPKTGSPYLKGNKVFTNMNDKTFFVTEVSSKNELWSTDGTTNGTQKIYRFEESYQMDMTSNNNNNKIFISTSNKVFISDGTSAGTKLLKQMDGTVLEGRVFTYNNYFVFAAKNTNYTNELWMTNGSDETFQIKDFDTNEVLNLHNDLSCYELNGKMLFYARNSSGTKNGLWLFDNNSKKGKFIKQLSTIVHGQILNNKLIFQGWDSVNGGSLYATDGTVENTVIISPSMHFLSAMTNQDNMVKLGNYVYFFPSSQNNVRNRLWKTDGTADGTVQTEVIIPDYASPEIITEFPLNEKIVIENASHNLWWLMDVSETVTPLNQNSLNYAVERENKIIFPYSNIKNGEELFQYDFGSHSISLLHDGNHRSGSFPNNISQLDSEKLVFTAYNSPYQNYFYSVKNNELPQSVKNINTSNIPEGNLFKVGNYFYVQPNSYIYSLAKTNGTDAGTKVISLPQNNSIDQYSSFGNLNDNALIFTTYYSATDRKIMVWKNAKDSDEIELIKEIPTGSTLPSIKKALNYNGEVYFTVSTPDHKIEIWKTDGTSENTKIAVEIPDFNYYSHIPVLLQVFDGKLLINKDEKLWAYDSATNSLTEITIKDFSGLGLNIAENTSEIDGKLYLLSQHGYGHVYRFDNLSTPPTKLFSENFMGAKAEFKKCGRKIFFANGNYNNKYHSLWSIDLQYDTVNQLITNNNQGANSVKDLVCIKDYLYFLKDGQSKIWRSEGSSSGTVQLNININNDEQIESTDEIQKLTSLNDKLYFVAKTTTSGEELYYVKTELPIYLNVSQTQSDDKKFKLILYPNPASSFIKIKENTSSEVETYKVFDMTGKQILSGKYKEENQSINISKLTSGNYIIEITTKNGNRFSQKFIKK